MHEEGSLIHDSLTQSDRGEAERLRTAAAGRVGSALLSDFSRKRRRKYLQAALWLVVSLVSSVLLAKSGLVQFDASGPGLLDPGYQKETKSSNGKVESVSYRVTYKFDARGKQFSGQDSLSSEPSSPAVTVYFLAGDPRQNALTEGNVLVPNLVAAGFALLIALVAYVLLPKSFRLREGMALPADSTGVGDSGFEFLRMKRGKYDAWGYVHVAFFVQAALVAAWAAFGIAVATHAKDTGSALMGTAVFVGIVSTLWIYDDRWNCIEAFSSRFCSGIANLSLFYLPAIAFFYANYRGFRKLQRR